MKYILFIILIFSFKSYSQYNHFTEIKTNGKVPAIGKIAKLGKISIFIIGAEWCSPCKGLKKRLEESKINNKKVDLYYIEISSTKDYKLFEKSNEFQFWTKVEGLETLPLIFITSQSSNILAKFSTEEQDIYKRIIETVESLILDTKELSNNIFYTVKKKEILDTLRIKQ